MIDQTDTPTPKVSVVDTDSLSIGPFTAATFNPEVMAAVGRLTLQVRDEVAAGMVELGKKMSEQVRVFKAATQGMQPPEPPLDMSPRAVALRARQNRHTGPRGSARTHRRR